MAYYLVQATYSREARAGMINNPHDRAVAGRQAVESLGGSLEGIWFAFGEYDIIAIAQFPDNSSAAAFALAISATGAASATRITPLMTIDEGTDAMRKAANAQYRHPHHPDAGQ